jgi:hypothetical protein
MYKLFILLILGIITTSGIVQNQKEIESEILKLEQLVVKGILEADTSILKQVWDPEFMVNTPRNNIAINRDAVFHNQKAGLINYSSFERVVERIKVQNNVAITMGNEIFISRNDLPEAKANEPIKRRFTNVWMKKNGIWLQIARYASIICN